MTDTAPATLGAYPIHARDKLRYGDTDRQGHVNNAVFSTFFETGRVEFLMDPENPILTAGHGFVIARIIIDYRDEIRWPGTVEVGTRVLSVGRSSIRLEQGLFQGERLVATAESVIVHISDETRRSAPLSPDQVAYLNGLMGG